MQKIRAEFTVYFEAPFWVGIYERIIDDQYQVCKVTFGPEPRDYQVYEFLSRNWQSMQFSAPVEMETFPQRRINPKRMSRQIARSLEDRGIGAFAQQTLKQQQEQAKKERKKNTRLAKEEKKQQQFEQKQKKRKEKHRGH